MSMRRSHIKRSARLTLEEHVVATKVNLGGLSRRPQLLQMTVAEFSLFVLFVADRLGVDDPFWYWAVVVAAGF